MDETNKSNSLLEELEKVENALCEFEQLYLERNSTYASTIKNWTHLFPDVSEILCKQNTKDAKYDVKSQIFSLSSCTSRVNLELKKEIECTVREPHKHINQMRVARRGSELEQLNCKTEVPHRKHKIVKKSNTSVKSVKSREATKCSRNDNISVVSEAECFKYILRRQCDSVSGDKYTLLVGPGRTEVNK